MADVYAPVIKPLSHADPNITLESLRRIPFSYATCSIGSTPSDTLPRKLEAIANAGFEAVELSFPDIIAFGSRTLGHTIAPENYAELITVSGEIKKLCEANSLGIMMLQPFANFEGWPRGSIEREDAFARANGWIEIMNVVGTDMLQVGSTDTDSSKMTGSREDIINDLRELCDMLAKRNMKLAYENWCWSTHAPKWKDVWDIVRDVDRPNIGLCLDTFQTAGGEWGDPTTDTSLVQDASVEELKQAFLRSLEDLQATIPPEKIYLLQVSDAYKPPQPFENKEIQGLRPRARWSHDFRPLPYSGGYLPIEEVAKAVLRTGFRGWFSMEVFDGGPDGKGKQYDMDKFSKDALQSMKRLLKTCATDT